MPLWRPRIPGPGWSLRGARNKEGEGTGESSVGGGEPTAFAGETGGRDHGGGG